MITRWDLGDDVRVIRNVRNDGTYPGEQVGALLIRRGSTGTIIAGIGPRTVPDVVYHALLLSVLVTGLTWAVRCRQV